MPPVLQLDLQQIVSQALAFIVLVWAMRRFAWKPLLATLDARKARIEDGLKQIEEGKAQAERLQQQLQSRLEKIDEETRNKIQDAIRDGRRVAAEIQDEARAQAQEILAKAKDTIELELAKAKITLRDDMTDMTLLAVQDLLRQKLNPETDKALVASILDELSQSSKPSR